MPTYYVYDTTVKLYAWDPHQPPRCKIEETTNNNAVFPIDPAYGREVEALEEECFNSKEGVDFLGSDMPFFLCHSGRDLFYKAPTTPMDMTEPSVGQGRTKRFTVGDGATAPDRKKSGKIWSSVGLLHEEDEGDSALSSISSSMFGESSPPSIAARTPRNASPRTGRKSDEYDQKSEKSHPSTIVSKPIATATPIMVNVELSKKSFIKSINTNDDQDICVSIFCNGQFTCSRVVRSRTATSWAASRMAQPFGGRRVDTNLEVPWVVLPLTQDNTYVSNNAQESSSFADRWNNINQLLDEESDQWGRTGKDGMFKAPLGEYLEELSRREVPESMRNIGAVGSKAGIIDVVVSVGLSTTITHWSNLTAPQRKFPEQVCGKNQQCFRVPEELKPQRKAQIMADFERDEAVRASNSMGNRQSRMRSSKDEHRSKGNITIKMHLDDTRNRFAPMSPLPHVYPASQDELSSSQPLALVMESAKLKHQGSVPAPHSSMPQQRSSSKEDGLPTTTSRGRSPVDAHGGHTRKGQPDNPWEFLPFDAQQSPSRSTRSRRSRSISASTPDNIRGQELVDSYLTLRNRTLEELPSTPLEYSPQLNLVADGIALSTGLRTERESDSSQSRPLTQLDLRSRTMSRLHTEEELSKESGLGLDGAGNARKRKSGFSEASASTPPRPSKRKRATSGSNTMLGDSERSSNDSLENVNHTTMVSGHIALKFGERPESPLNMEEEQSHATSWDPGLVNKKRRRPSGAMFRELSSLLTPHKPAMEVDSSFGASFTEASSTRPTRNPPTRQGKLAIVAKVETSQPETSHVTANYQRPLLTIEGLASLTLDSMTRTSVKHASRGPLKAASEPLPNTGGNGRAAHANVNEKLRKTNDLENRVSRDFKEPQDGSKASMTSVETAMDSGQIPGVKPSRSSGKSRENLPKSNKNAENTAFTPSTGKKPVGAIKPIGKRDSRPPQLSHPGMQTSTKQSMTTFTPKYIETPHTLPHTVSSGATTFNTPGTTGITSRVAPGSSMRRSASRPRAASTAKTTGNSNATPVESRISNRSELADLAWKPDVLFADSVLSYATGNVVEGWVGNEYGSQSGSAYRGTKQEREAVFRASGILMGVRFVLGGGS